MSHTVCTINHSLTPRFSGVWGNHRIENRFKDFLPAGKRLKPFSITAYDRHPAEAGCQ